MTDPLDQTLTEQARAITEERITVQDILTATRARIGARDTAFRSVVYLPETDNPASGPLQGLPIGIKDLLDVDGQPTRCGSHAHSTTGPEGTALQRLRAAGLTQMAKLATY
ncbi:amidase family protein [Sagittula sp. S175]|uniref:amidase family protein n=1 Tax=Sagittula sp. S175 TaxID=3415129 RepID=UPI003C7BAB22